jgi:hypothetical protein
MNFKSFVVRPQPKKLVAEFNATKYWLILNDSMRIGNTGTAPAANAKSEKGKTTEINFFRSLNFCLFK